MLSLYPSTPAKTLTEPNYYTLLVELPNKTLPSVIGTNSTLSTPSWAESSGASVV